MDPSKVDWLPALLVLAAGLALGAVVTWRLGRSREEPGSSAEPPAKPDQPTDAAARPASAVRGFLWSTGAMAGVGVLLFSVAQAAKPRGESEPLTGASAAMASPRPSAATSVTIADPAEAAAKAVLTQDPESVEARLELARVSLDKEDYMAVWNETQRVLSRSPEEPRALTYQSQVRLAMGQPDVALDMLKRALAKDPGLLQAYIYVSYVHLRMGQTRDAEAAMAEAKRRFPDQAASLDRGFADMRAGVEKEGAMAPAGDANPHARLGAGNPHPGPAPSVSGTVDLDPALKGQVAPGSVVFLTVREAGFGAGPPIAAKRLSAAAFPVSFEISAADSMRGEPIPGEMLLEARLDADGDPLTRDPSDPAARLEAVKGGSTGVRLVLRRP